MTEPIGNKRRGIAGMRYLGPNEFPASGLKNMEYGMTIARKTNSTNSEFLLKEEDLNCL
jgi:hypothetical protein